MGRVANGGSSIRGEVSCRGRDLLVCETSEDISDDLVERLLVVWLQLLLVLVVQFGFVEVQVNGNLFVLLELHDDEGVSRLTLPKGRVQPETEHHVSLVGFRKHHVLLDGVVLNLVVVGLATESERSLVHIDIETASGNEC
jgi:hypothetical protein